MTAGIRVAVDAMGGDRGPEEVVAGALAGLHRVTQSQIVYTWLWPGLFCVLVFALPMSDAHALAAVAASMTLATLIGGVMLLRRLRRRPDSRPRFKGQSFNRLIPNILTLIGLCAGLNGMRLAMDGEFGPAAVALLIGGIAMSNRLLYVDEVVHLGQIQRFVSGS